MSTFTVQAEGSKSYTIYSQDNGKYYRQNMTWWETGGYCVPQARKVISKAEYERMKEIYDKD